MLKLWGGNQLMLYHRRQWMSLWKSVVYWQLNDRHHCWLLSTHRQTHTDVIQSVTCQYWLLVTEWEQQQQCFTHSSTFSCFSAVGEEQISSIGRGLCVLLGISVEDTQRDADYMWVCGGGTFSIRNTTLAGFVSKNEYWLRDSSLNLYINNSPNHDMCLYF